MSVFAPVGALLSIGGATLFTIGGLNPQRLSYASEARFPAHAIPAGLSYQKTGLGMQTMTVEAVTAPHVMGGMDAFAMLKAYHEMQATVPFIRMSGNFLGLANGLCVIETFEYDEEKLHPFDGIGRRIDVVLNLIMLPQSLAGVDRTGILGFGGLL